MVAEEGLEAVSRILLCSKMCVYTPLLAEYGSFFPNNPTFSHCWFSRKGKNKGKLLQQLYQIVVRNNHLDQSPLPSSDPVSTALKDTIIGQGFWDEMSQRPCGQTHLQHHSHRNHIFLLQILHRPYVAACFEPDRLGILCRRRMVLNSLPLWSTYNYHQWTTN